MTQDFTPREPTKLETAIAKAITFEVGPDAWVMLDEGEKASAVCAARVVMEMLGAVDPGGVVSDAVWQGDAA